MRVLGRHARWTAAFTASIAVIVTPASATGAASTSGGGRGIVKRIGFAAAPLGQRWPDDTTYGAWYSLHDGFGLTQVGSIGGVRVLTMATRAASAASETYSSLVRTWQRFGDVDFTVTLLTTAQLRSPAPNPWEVAWVLWRYTDNQHFYSFIVKPSGWELAKEDPAYPGSQRFLVYANAPSFPIGRRYRVRVRHVGDTVTIWVGGVRLVRFTDRERPYGSGSIALYAEDSAVRYGAPELRSLRR